MDGQVRTGFVRASRLHRWTATAAIALAVSGCVSPAFRTSVGTFGAATKAAVSAQRDDLAAITARERDRIRTDLARPRVVLDYQGRCAPSDSPSAASAGCAMVSQVVGGRFEAVPEAPKFRHIVELENALANYGDSLIALAADSSADQTALAASITGFAASASELNDAIRKASGAQARDLSAPLGAVASLVGELANLYLAHERDRVLRDIIISGAPLVRSGIDLLRETASEVEQERRAALSRGLDAARSKARTLALTSGASTTEIRQAQDRLFDLLEAYNRPDTSRPLFEQMAIAHESLVRAAGRGASAADLRAAIDAITHLAATAHNAVTAINAASRSTDNANPGQ